MRNSAGFSAVPAVSPCAPLLFPAVEGYSAPSSIRGVPVATAAGGGTHRLARYLVRQKRVSAERGSDCSGGGGGGGSGS